MTKTLRAAEGVDAVVERARRSAELLGTQPVDALLVHSASDLSGSSGDKLWRALSDLRDEGYFGRIGISAYVADDPVALAARFAPALMQVPLNLLDQRLLADGSLAALKRRGIEVHVRSIFLQGLFFLTPDRLPPKLSHARESLVRIHGAIAAAGMTPLRAAVRFALSCPDVDVALVGVTSRAELDAILAARFTTDDPDWSRYALDDEVLLTPSLWQD